MDDAQHLHFIAALLVREDPVVVARGERFVHALEQLARLFGDGGRGGRETDDEPGETFAIADLTEHLGHRLPDPRLHPRTGPVRHRFPIRSQPMPKAGSAGSAAPKIHCARPRSSPAPPPARQLRGFTTGVVYASGGYAHDLFGHL